MKKHLIVSGCLLFVCLLSYSQSLWKEETAASQRSYLSRIKDTLPANARFYTLNAAAFRTKMQAARPFHIALPSTAELELPLADGRLIMAEVYESSILSSELQALIPHVKTYMLVDKTTKNRLGRISKRGNQYLRRLLINGASANLLRSKATNADPWVIGLRRRRPSMVVAVAMANKTARIAWAVMHRNEDYQRMAVAA